VLGLLATLIIDIPLVVPTFADEDSHVPGTAADVTNTNVSKLT
jgi:hypothetical protein